MEDGGEWVLAEVPETATIRAIEHHLSHGLLFAIGIAMESVDTRYLDIVLNPLRVCASYRPKLGQGGKGGLSLVDFQRLYRADPFYSWFGLDNPLMYAAHKAAGGMTSVYRQIGIGSELLFRTILQDQFGLTEEQSRWSYSIIGANKKNRRLSLDGRIKFEHVSDARKRLRVERWLHKVCKELGVESTIIDGLQGIVFEVRQGYKSKDSKRQNADIANAATAYSKAYLPCALIMSSQMDSDILHRYRLERWSILTGDVAARSTVDSTYEFMRKIVGYDLAAFFTRNSRKLRDEVAAVLKTLLSTR